MAQDGVWTDLCRLDQVPPGTGGYVEVGDRGLAVLRAPDGEVSVLDNRCPHAGAALSGGAVTEDGLVVCPWHGWAFELSSGRCPDAPGIGVRVYPVRVLGERVEAQLE